MAAIFDFSKLSHLLGEHKQKVIIIVDTNVFINNPDFTTWNTCGDGLVFLLPDLMLKEILVLENKSKKAAPQEAEKFLKVRSTAQDSEKFLEAHKAFDRLLEEWGDLSEGVYVDRVGWFITIYSPSELKLRSEIDELHVLPVTHHGPIDAIFLLLGRQCREAFKNQMVVFVTGDYGLRSAGSLYGVLTRYCRELPDRDFDSWLEQQITKRIEIAMAKDMEATVRKAENRYGDVTLTLTSKKFVRNWPCEVPDPELDGLFKVVATDVVVAEGYGSICMPDGLVNFLWRLPFKPWTSAVLARDPVRGEPSPLNWDECDEDGVPTMVCLMRESDIDFLGRDNEVPEEVRQELLRMLSTCENPSSIAEGGLPTVQSPINLLESIQGVHNLLDMVKSWEQGDMEDSKLPSLKSMDYNSLRTLLGTWLSTHSAEEAAKFVDSVTECWNVGHTIRTRVELFSESKEES